MCSSLVFILGLASAQVPPAPQPPVQVQQLILRQQIIVGGRVPLVPPGQPAVAVQDDETLLRGVELPTDPNSLITFLRRLKIKEDDQARISDLILRLGDDDFETRQSATDELILVGPSAAQALGEALKSSDLEVVRRAETCLKAIDSVAGPTYQEAVVRLLAKKAPDVAVETLLEVLPDLSGPTITDTVAEVLAQAGIKAGRPVPALVLALRDKATIRREAAGEAIASAGDAEARKTVAVLLNDPEMTVRKRVALALFERAEPVALPALIKLLGELPLEQSYEVESALLTVAREKAPEVVLGKTAATRKVAVDAWQQWYKTTGEKLDLVKVIEESRKPGPLLISTMTLGAGNRYKVMELDATGKPTWELNTTGYAYSVQKLPRDRVLLSEYSGRKVQEKTTKGEVIWSKDNVNLPIEAVRLPDGNTLIATRNSLIEVNPEGKDVRTINRTDLLYSMTTMRNGDIGLVNSANRFIRLNREGKELSSFAIPGRMYSIGGHFAVAPNGNRITIPLYGGAVVVGGAVVQQAGRIVEFDANGTLIWETQADRPTSVRRLANGNLLVASRYHGTILELDSRGKTVNKYEAPGGGRVLDARR